MCVCACVCVCERDLAAMIEIVRGPNVPCRVHSKTLNDRMFQYSIVLLTAIFLDAD